MGGIDYIEIFICMRAVEVIEICKRVKKKSIQH